MVGRSDQACSSSGCKLGTRCRVGNKSVCRRDDRDRNGSRFDNGMHRLKVRMKLVCNGLKIMSSDELELLKVK